MKKGLCVVAIILLIIVIVILNPHQETVEEGKKAWFVSLPKIETFFFASWTIEASGWDIEGFKPNSKDPEICEIETLWAVQKANCVEGFDLNEFILKKEDGHWVLYNPPHTPEKRITFDNYPIF